MLLFALLNLVISIVCIVGLVIVDVLVVCSCYICDGNGEILLVSSVAILYSLLLLYSIVYLLGLSNSMVGGR